MNRESSKVKDPVCGMQVDPDKTAQHSVYEGQTYHFCSSVCKSIFDRESPKYAAAPSSKGKTNPN
jgi:Cu+-exporting ATPase